MEWLQFAGMVQVVSKQDFAMAQNEEEPPQFSA